MAKKAASPAAASAAAPRFPSGAALWELLVTFFSTYLPGHPGRSDKGLWFESRGSVHYLKRVPAVIPIKSGVGKALAIGQAPSLAMVVAKFWCDQNSIANWVGFWAEHHGPVKAALFAVLSDPPDDRLTVPSPTMDGQPVTFQALHEAWYACSTDEQRQTMTRRASDALVCLKGNEKSAYASASKLAY